MARDLPSGLNAIAYQSGTAVAGAAKERARNGVDPVVLLSSRRKMEPLLPVSSLNLIQKLPCIPTTPKCHESLA